jgi:hypothetical protein
LAEIRLFVHVTVFTMRTDVPGIDADMLTASILKTAKRYHKYASLSVFSLSGVATFLLKVYRHVIYVPLNYRLQKRLCKLDEVSPPCAADMTPSHR